MVTITCKLPEETAARLAGLARQQHRSKSAVLRESLELRLQAEQGTPEPKAIDRVRHLQGVLKGGPSDLATNPEHMRGFGE